MKYKTYREGDYLPNDLGHCIRIEKIIRGSEQDDQPILTYRGTNMFTGLHEPILNYRKASVEMLHHEPFSKEGILEAIERDK